MKNAKRASRKRDIIRRGSDSDYQLVESNHTSLRPPHFNESNLSSTNMSGHDQIADSHADADTCFEDGYEVIRPEDAPETPDWRTYIVPSVSDNTDSTVKQGAGRTEPGYAVTPNSGAYTLTAEALQAHDHQQSSHHHVPGDTRGWVQQGLYTPQQLSNHSTEVMPDRSRSSGSYTELSWNHVAPPLESPVSQTDDDVCDTGAQFVDAPSTFHIYGSTIPDELLWGHEA